MRTLWSGEQHLSRVRQLPGLTRFVQNYIVASPGGHVCDGVGELWFEHDEVMGEALGSPEKRIMDGERAVRDRGREREECRVKLGQIDVEIDGADVAGYHRRKLESFQRCIGSGEVHAQMVSQHEPDDRQSNLVLGADADGNAP